MESSIVSKKKFPKSIMVFGVIACGYKSELVVINNSVDSEQYIENMKKSKFIDNLNEKLGPFEWLYMQDGARCHTSAMAMEWLEDKVDVITDWPANSPDLNPIELLWAILKRVVAAESPNSVEELKNLLLKTWNNIKIS